MRILIIGTIVFLIWLPVSIHFYIFKIKHLCNEQEEIQTATFSDSLSSNLKTDQNLFPGVMTINFAFDKSEFSPDMATDNYFEKSKAFIANNAEARLSIIGYTDSVGSDSYNISLGFRRAESLKDYFERKGITEGKIKVESKGEREPADENNTNSGRANNRRTVITIKN